MPEQRLVPCLAVGPAELDLAPLTEQARKPVRGGRLGEHVVLVDVSVGARALGTEAETNVQALREGEDLFLAVERKRPLLRLQFELAAEHRSLVDVRLPGEQSLGYHPPTIKLAVLNLHSRRRGGAERAAPRCIRVDRVQIPVPLPAVRVRQRRGARGGRGRLEKELRRCEYLIRLAKEVDAARRDEFEIVVRGLRGLERERAAAGEPGDHFVVLPQGDRLQRVGAEVGDRRLGIHAVLRRDRDEPWNVRNRVRDARAVVVVVGESLVGLVPSEGGVDAQLQTVRKRLVYIGAQALAVVECVADDAPVPLGVS